MLKIKYQKDNFEFPENWSEISWANLIKLIQGELGNFEVIQNILGLPQEKFEALPADLYNAFEKALLQLGEIDVTLSEPPVAFLFRGNVYDMTDEIGTLPIGQYKDALHKIQKLGVEATNIDIINLFPEILAVYLQPKVTSKSYDSTEAKKLVKDIFACSGLDVLAFGNFFLQKATLLKNGSQKTLLTTNIQKSKKGRVMTFLQKVLALFTRSKR
jgi:hypothetical protein